MIYIDIYIPLLIIHRVGRGDIIDTNVMDGSIWLGFPEKIKKSVYRLLELRNWL